MLNAFWFHLYWLVFDYVLCENLWNLKWIYLYIYEQPPANNVLIHDTLGFIDIDVQNIMPYGAECKATYDKCIT